MTHTLTLLAIACSALLATASPIVEPRANNNPTQIIAHGGTLTDTGNVFQLTNGSFPAPPYYQGRFSNGPIYVDQLASSTSIPVTSTAHAGSTTDDAVIQGSANGVLVPSLADQIAAFRPTNPIDQRYATKEQVILWSGAGNAFSSWFGGSKNITGTASAESYVDQIRSVLENGAKRVLVFNLDPLYMSPSWVNDPAGYTYFRDFVKSFNKYLKNFNWTCLEEQYSPDVAEPTTVDVKLFDVEKIVRGAINNLSGSDKTKYCLSISGQVCSTSQANKYVFWDLDGHYNTWVHRKIATAVRSTLHI
ncbi:hypothetical protein DFS34DRAFT_650181 [Phlyctochytrium arcticum]|nr:hypothetical protein DFS34DRAFT_650181 [Phlyctochytrium arcticum]